MRKNPQALETTKITEIAVREKKSVIQGNAISRSLYSCPVLVRKIIMFAGIQICTRQNIEKANLIKEIPDTDVVFISPKELTVKFKISEFMNALGLTDSGTNYGLIRNSVEDVLSAKIVLENTENKFTAFNWFSATNFDKNSDSFELTFTQQVGYGILNHTNGYTTMSLGTIGKFKSIYALRYYEIAMSFIGNKGRNGNEYGKWFFQYSFDELRKLFKVPDDCYSDKKYGNRNFFLKIVKEPISELNLLSDEIRIDIVKILQGRKTVGVKFECTDISKKMKINKTDSFVEKKEKEEFNEDLEMLKNFEAMKEKYPDVFEKYFEDEKKNTPLFFIPEIAMKKVYEKMISEGFSF